MPSASAISAEQVTTLSASLEFQGFCHQMHRFVAEASEEASLRTAIPRVVSIARELDLPPERILRAFRDARCRVPTPAPDDTYTPQSKRYSEAVAWLLEAYFGLPSAT